MSTPAHRLAGLGLALPSPPAPVAAYVRAVRTGSLLFTSGQLPFVDGALEVTGQVAEGSDQVPPERARELAATAALNALAVVAAEVGGLERVRAVKLVGYVASAPGFTGQPGVVDGASRLLLDVLGEAGRHARSAVGVASLPLGAPVEVELVVEVADGS
ncbi:RidA family protein [Quadrisphaera sp. DSM 44207]|uniref:RidA family protein n=1 Tax=Quadrisphaera sp. DSM 44207 TaxID=1881057 RepID=UPI000889FCB0|nr:RidA family protein [Quadrisphaera sp. DSM 44207]SDQ18051.1 Enamine deaminase RidA, house cleaning of reactive enamine intermediates, YjgF/YER057c/UK114 family [Quadrisphaera sp. DSM 44207]